ncbi:hypothetical protein [Conexibacter arvalis]|uniref:Uncharacterized protein n=1 Tax=Conexibacter arvalis TaxID=912552 RepID=A0A840IE35_9ACTN|nr:hypothetical protein [Conexibacter arvalis]MBB4662200.1 hypothetical protein [Conexibacter arvalis]
MSEIPNNLARATTGDFVTIGTQLPTSGERLCVVCVPEFGEDRRAGLLSKRSQQRREERPPPAGAVRRDCDSTIARRDAPAKA